MPNRTSSDAGIVVEASRDLIRKGAEKVLSDFTMSVEDPDGGRYTKKESLDEGDTIVFKEKIGFCPALVIATKLGQNMWFLMASSECPEIKCDDRQAMKCARLNDQNLRILRDFVDPNEDAKILTEWRSGLSNPAKLEMIIDRTTRKWTH
ncbi:MAG: hypothetical protein ACW98Y_05275 [Candidatus Thorarchaeota archaeon]|jgi:hypothetical protein